MGKNYVCELRRAHCADKPPFKLIQVERPEDSDDEDLEEVIFQASKRMADIEPLVLWPAKEDAPKQKHAAALMMCLLCSDPYAGAGRNELLVKVTRWAHAMEFDSRYPEIWKHVPPFFNKLFDKSWTAMNSQGVSHNTLFAASRPFCGKLLGIGAWETCLKADKDWSLARIVGQQVFAQALRSVAAGTASIVIDKALAQLVSSVHNKDKTSPPPVLIRN